MPTAREILDRGAGRLRSEGVESAQLDMSLLLAEALGTTRLMLYTDLDRELTPAQLEAARAMLRRRLAREPVAYILGRREFFGLTLDVTPAVLIPRPETEHLVEAAIGWLREIEPSLPSPLCADIGTGSGAIAIAVARACPATRWIATDVSEAALEVARRNAERHGVAERIEFRAGSLLDPISKTLDVLCANLPYIAETDRAALAPEITRYEPSSALFAGADGLALLHPFIDAAPSRLRPGGLLLMECGADQADALAMRLAASGALGVVQILKDHAGHDRVIQATRQ